MKEVVYYTKLEAGFESFPAENYVDYMTNVMSVPERHIFSISKYQTSIVCIIDEKHGDSTHLWALLHEVFSIDSSRILEIETNEVVTIFSILQDASSPRACNLCEEKLGAFIKN